MEHSTVGQLRIQLRDVAANEMRRLQQFLWILRWFLATPVTPVTPATPVAVAASQNVRQSGSQAVKDAAHLAGKHNFPCTQLIKKVRKKKKKKKTHLMKIVKNELRKMQEFEILLC